jgi:hypothetical protein
MSRSNPDGQSDHLPADRELSGSVGDQPISFHRAFVGDGLAVVDIVQRQRYTIETDTEVTPTAADADGLLFPVDAAAWVTTDHLLFPSSPCVYVRGADGEMLVDATPPTEQRFPAGEYYVEVNTPIKLYLRVEGPMTVTATVDSKRVELDAPRRVTVGGRSMHERPAATVTTTAKPTDVMAAVSTFGSALKTTSPERSFPTLRGHPPAMELGDELSIPEDVVPPTTGVTVEVPRDYRHVYPVASLAYYLGARVVPGERPRLVTDAGFVHDLAPGGEFEREVERVLKGTFLLDCVTRTEGLYEVDLHERRAVERAADIDFAALYHRPLSERLAAYLSVPYESLAPSVPDWKLTTYVEADAGAAETLPFVVNDLAVIRTDASGSLEGSADSSADPGIQQEAVDDLLRNSRSVAATSAPTSVAVEGSGSMELSWIGEGAPRGASKATAAAYRNRLDRSPAEGDISVTVVCNDPEMLDERDVVEEVYGAHAETSVELDRQGRLTRDEFRTILSEGTSFLHYIGHIDEAGFRCTDGTLDAATLDDIGVESFLLNACSSYDPGMALIEAGAIGGIVTLAEVANESAVRMGSTVARVLNNGYPLRPALEIARHASYLGDDYIVVGDGTEAVAKSSSIGLDFYRLRRDSGLPVLEFVSYSSVNNGMGYVTCPNVDGNERYYLTPGTVDEFRMSGVDELLDFLHLKDVPVLIEDTLHWSTDVGEENLPTESLR